MCLIAYDIFWDVPLILFINFHSRLDEEQLPFYTATDTVTDLLNVERAGNRQQDAMLHF